MKRGKNRIRDYFKQSDEGNRVPTLMKSGNLKKVSGKQQHALNIKRNQIISMVLAFLLIIIGLISVFS